MLSGAGHGQWWSALQGHTGLISCVAVSADGRRLFSGSGDATIKIWDLETGKEALTLRGHAAGVTSLVRSADGKWLFSGSEDQTITVWDLETGKEALTLRGQAGPISGLALSAAEGRVLSFLLAGDIRSE